MTIDFGDETWTDEKWFELLDGLRARGLLTWKEITALTIGHLNPSQVGTSLASSEGFKQRYGKGNTMRVVMKWFYSQTGKCTDCGTRLELQADHSKPRESFANPLDADFIENMVLRCRRCNVVRRPSHQFGGQTNLTAEAALMWILFVLKPRTLADFTRMCRIYGMTMADIRMHEGWAMAHWLHSIGEYEIENDCTPCQILHWTDDNAITRCWKNDVVSGNFSVIHDHVNPSTDMVVVVAADQDGKSVLTAFRMPVGVFPFSHYFESLGLPGQSLAIIYSPPERKKKNGNGPQLLDLVPRGMLLIAHDLVDPNNDATITLTAGSTRVSKTLTPKNKRAKLLTLDSTSLATVTAMIS